ncbi:MAG: hypothetical protein JSW39_01275 [Desulfobacterales bacterium]|nr:MAG: hypothetical protein JSW39_01275 [Desulfobacterales bacterium]
MMKLKWILIIGPVLLLAALFLWRSGASDELPHGVWGHWETTDSRYQDRFFEVSHATLAFGTGRGGVERYSIAGVEKASEGNGSHYTIHYNDEEGSDYKISFYYDPTNGGAIRFKNQKQIRWTRIGND